MLLSHVRVQTFKSIDDSGEFAIDPKVTVLVGQNESGKTALLRALQKARPIEKGLTYNVEEDYPRKNLIPYQKQHAKHPATVAVLSYHFEEHEITAINKALGIELIEALSFSISHNYAGGRTVSLQVAEDKYIEHFLNAGKLPPDVVNSLSGIKTIRDLINALDAADLNAEAAAAREALKGQFGPSPESWNNLLGYYIWKNFIGPRVPSFAYFDEYRLLPGKINLPQLQAHIVAHKQNAAQPIPDELKTAVALLEMAGVGIDELIDSSSYESIKAKLEGISNIITDKIFRFWTQNSELDVEFDIRQDPKDSAPFNSGYNLYIRIRSRRHRVTVPFDQRSKGFRWFFSFLVWFDDVKGQLETEHDLILLLDEPGLSLHALAQEDLLKYIDELATIHQILYTTHSPFMVNNDRLDQARTVEDKPERGTVVSENITTSDAKTLFPLQAALGYTIAQNLFISKRNLLVEGPSELIYLKLVSGVLESLPERKFLRDDVTIVPVGGLGNLSTFISLLGANRLEIVVMHDFKGAPEPQLQALVKDKLIRDKAVLNCSMFRDGAKSISSDIEDLFEPNEYMALFNSTFMKQLTKPLKAEDLPPGNRIVERIGRHLDAKGVSLRPSGGFNHYLVASHAASNPPLSFTIDTLGRFEEMFKAVNPLYS